MAKKIKDPYILAEIEHQKELDSMSKDFEKQNRETERKMVIDIKKERYSIGTQLRIAVLNKFEHKCRDCFETDEDILEIHHTDMNNDHTYLANLVPLCPNCHTKRHKDSAVKKYLKTGLMRKAVKNQKVDKTLRF
ncbi:MAG: HNH endonuclease signature motif containing protein [archaeon]